MSESMNVQKDSAEILVETSRTFSIPISLLSPGLKEAVTAAYLCMRAIDEIEDHSELPKETKSKLLFSISEYLNHSLEEGELYKLLQPYNTLLPEVTIRLEEWIHLCPAAIKKEIVNATSIMAKGMAEWVMKDWEINNKDDLDEYTYYVAGLVGVMLSDIWNWYDASIKTDKDLAIAFGRGLQIVNILRNREEDKERGVDFFPKGWEYKDMLEYAKRNLALADKYLENISQSTILNFCKIPLALAHATLEALVSGKEKISRKDVGEIVNKVVE